MEDEDKTIKQSLLPKAMDDLPIPVQFHKVTKALFYEFRFQTTVKDKAPYTLGNHDYERDGHIYLSMYQIYMTCDSEYEAAIKILGSFPHWRKLKKCKWFQEYIEQWESERNIRDEAIARSQLVKLAEAGNVTAARTLYANSKATTKERGRPPKGGSRTKGPALSDLDVMLGRSEGAGEGFTNGH